MKKLLLILVSALVTTMASFAEKTPEPVITYESVGYEQVYVPDMGYQQVCAFCYNVTATGEGDVHLYLNGVEVNNPCTIPQDLSDWWNLVWEVSYTFVATAQADGCEISETSRVFTVPSIPEVFLTYDEDSESFWMSFNSQYDISGHSRIGDGYSDYFTYSEPFKVWQAPQCIRGDIYVDMWTSSYNEKNDSITLSSNMGIIYDLSNLIANSGIFRYYDYRDGIYFPYGYNSSQYYEESNAICNKYWEPSEHPACYTGDVVIPECVAKVYDNTFYNCSNLASVTIPSTVTYIGKKAFFGCTGLDSVNISSLANWCSISFVDSLSNPLYYSDHLYLDGEEIKDLELENGFDFMIKRYAFAGFKGLTSITCHSISPQNAYVNAFYNLYDRVPLFVPNESLEAYRAHEEWGRFSHIVPFLGAGPGDVNGDGTINIADVTGLIDKLLSGEELPAYYDVDGDGLVNIKDVTDLIDILLNGN